MQECSGTAGDRSLRGAMTRANLSSLADVIHIRRLGHDHLGSTGFP
jgi:hypothetical protein